MANSFTANLNLEKPEVGADSNLWGGHLNSDLDILDSIFTTATTRPISTIIKSNTKWVDATTTSKSILLSLSGITTTTGRTLTVQDADGTVAYTSQIATSTVGLATTGDVAVATSTTVIMDLTSVQTATNKTFTSPIINTGVLGSSTATTQAQADNSTKVATTAYADRIGVQQIIYTQFNAIVTTAGTALPFDDTIPQKTEGDQVMTLGITPKITGSKIVVRGMAMAANNSGSVVAQALAIFQDSTADAVAAVAYASADSPNLFPFEFEVTNGTASVLTTFNVRIGTNAANIMYLNGQSAGTRLFGGIAGSFMEIIEYSP